MQLHTFTKLTPALLFLKYPRITPFVPLKSLSTISTKNDVKLDNNIIFNLFDRLLKHPELSGNELHTKNICTDFLTKYIEKSKIYEMKNSHGFIVELFFDPKNKNTLFFRTDMDAVPVKGISHACGHNGHMCIAMQLAIKLIQNNYNMNNVYLIFQPSEENAEGAKSILKDPIFLKIINKQLNAKLYFLALHNIPSFETGQIILTKGSTFSSAVTSKSITINGKQSHAAYPEMGCNPIMPISDAVKKISKLNEYYRSININNKITIVHVEVGKLWNGGTSPGDGELCVTFRTENNDDMDNLLRHFFDIFKKILGHHFKYSISDFDFFPATQNCNYLTKMIKKIYPDRIIYLDKPFSWGEDFGYFLQKYQGIMFGIGSGINNTDLHTSTYKFPKELIEIGANTFYNLAKNI